MRSIEVKQLDYDLTPTAGLALVGHFLKTLAPVLADVDAALPVRAGVASSDIVRSYLGLLVQGKSDFDAIENLRGDKFFKQALGIGLLPSSPTLRQRMDAHAAPLAEQGMPMIERLLTRHAPDSACCRADGCRWTSTLSRWTTAAPPRKVWAAPMPAWTATARWPRTWARTASAWTWCCGLDRSAMTVLVGLLR